MKSSAQFCDLCDLPLRTRISTLSFSDRAYSFCCNGCKQVFQMLAETHGAGDPASFKNSELFMKCRELGIIPGSQGAPSYIVRGRGNPESFTSCSHGAGRKMGRKEAQRRLDLAEEAGRLDRQGILHSIRGRRDLDEAAGAYKDVDRVVENQIDLVEVVVALRPLAVIKG